MKEHYKDTIILVTALASVRNLRWRSSCAVKFLKDEREAVEYLTLDLDYDTSGQAERAGLLFSKKWVDLILWNQRLYCRHGKMNSDFRPQRIFESVIGSLLAIWISCLCIRTSREACLRIGQFFSGRTTANFHYDCALDCAEAPRCRSV
jgi:hypothetical protein